MNIRVIVEDASGKRFTLPIEGVGSINWQMEGEAPTFVCQGPRESLAMSPRTLVELPATIVRTIYRDDEKAKPGAPRATKAQRNAESNPS